MLISLSRFAGCLAICCAALGPTNSQVSQRNRSRTFLMPWNSVMNLNDTKRSDASGDAPLSEKTWASGRRISAASHANKTCEDRKNGRPVLQRYAKVENRERGMKETKHTSAWVINMLKARKKRQEGKSVLLWWSRVNTGEKGIYGEVSVNY